MSEEVPAPLNLDTPLQAAEEVPTPLEHGTQLHAAEHGTQCKHKPTHPAVERRRQFCFEADAFPSEDILKYLTDTNGVNQMRFCSAPGAPQFAQLLKFGQPWRGGVLIFMRHSRKNGMTRQKWERIAESLLMRPVTFENPRKILWHSMLVALQPGDPRAQELNENYQHFKLGAEATPGYMSPTASSAAAREQEEERAQDAARAAEACEQVETAATAAAVAGLVPRVQARAFKKRSLKATLAYIEKKVQCDKDEYLAGQPSKKRRRLRNDSMKSKKPEHVAAALLRAKKKAEREERKAKVAAVAAGVVPLLALPKLSQQPSPQPSQQPSQQPSLQPSQQQPPKPKKTVTFAEPEAVPDSQEPEPRAKPPQLSLAQRVVHRTLPQPEGQEWKYAVAELLQSRYTYAHGSRRGGAAVATLKKLLAEVGAAAVYFSTRNGEGLGALFPAPEAQTHANFPSTLELHRCALALERAAEQLLRACVARVCEDPAAASLLSPSAAADLQAAWRARGGISGAGSFYWPAELDAGLYPLECAAGAAPAGQIAACIQALRAGRASAFRRRYLVLDEVTWCVPYLAKLYFLRCKAPALSPGQLRGVYQSLTGYRLCAVRADAAPLVGYARGCLAYAARLSAIAADLGAPGESTALELSAAVLARAPQAPAQDLEVIRCRAAEEAREAKSVLQDLGLAKSPALRAAAKLRLAVATAMHSDSHTAEATRHLHPSPSMPGAIYDPQRYLQG